MSNEDGTSISLELIKELRNKTLYNFTENLTILQ